MFSVNLIENEDFLEKYSTKLDLFVLIRKHLGKHPFTHQVEPNYVYKYFRTPMKAIGDSVLEWGVDVLHRFKALNRKNVVRILFKLN